MSRGPKMSNHSSPSLTIVFDPAIKRPMAVHLVDNNHGDQVRLRAIAERMIESIKTETDEEDIDV